MRARVITILPLGAFLPDSITMVLGTTSLGYVNDEGIYIVNYLVGGTYQLNQYRAQYSEGEARKASQRFVDYADTMDAQGEARFQELFVNLEKLMNGDIESYMEYARFLPDIPGYLHGVIMSKNIDEVFGREALIESVTDPVRILLLSMEALKKKGLNLPLSDSIVKLLKNLIR